MTQAGAPLGRVVAGIAAGVFAWFAIATVGDLLLRASWRGYADVHAAMTFSLQMLAARLLLGALSSIGAGLVLTWITRAGGSAAYILGGLLVVLFVPAHYGLWDKFPIWYHVVFLGSLLPLVVVGARIVPPRMPNS